MSVYTGRPILVDPELPLETHMVLGTLGFDLPEAFRLPAVTLFTERNCRAWQRQCREILKLPIEGAYRQLIDTIGAYAGAIADRAAAGLGWADLERTYQQRARTLTEPIMDEGAHEGHQRLEGFST